LSLPNKVHNLPGHQHLLFFGEANVDIFVCSNKFSEMHIAEVAIAAAASTA
jgi:hypothetical protein